NAHNKVHEKDPFVLQRSDAYIGVLIDDLINKGTEEPYRMFTSRAEFRLLLRQDNADLRLTELGYKIGLASEARYQKMVDKRENTRKLTQQLEEIKLSPNVINDSLADQQTAAIREKIAVEKLIKRPNLGLQDLIQMNDNLAATLSQYSKEVLEQAEIQIKYQSYIDKEQQLVEKMSHMENYRIPKGFDYTAITALSAEGKQKLNKVQPETLGQASRISGVTPADLSILTVYLGR